MIKENTKVTGKVNIVLLDSAGNVKDKRDVNNLVVTAGLTLIAQRLLSAAEAVPSHMAVGTGSTPPASGDTALETELTRVAFTSATNTANDIEFVGTFGAGVGTGVITEAGNFNAGVAGTMLNRVTFGSVNKGALDSMIITWTLSVG